MLVINREKAVQMAMGLGKTEAEKDVYTRTCKMASKIRRGDNDKLLATMGMNEYTVCALKYSEFIGRMPGKQMDDFEYNMLSKEDKKAYIVLED